MHKRLSLFIVLATVCMSMKADTRTCSFYNTRVQHFERLPFSDVLPDLVERHLSPEKHPTLLDVGAGPGAVAQWLVGRGHNVLCVEPAQEMVQACKQKGLTVVHGTIQEFTSDETFHAIVALSSLIHVPSAALKDQFRHLYALLKDEGIMIMSLILGDSKGWFDPTDAGMLRFYSFVQESTVRAHIADLFTVEEWHIVEDKQMGTYLIFVLRKAS